MALTVRTREYNMVARLSKSRISFYRLLIHRDVLELSLSLVCGAELVMHDLWFSGVYPGIDSSTAPELMVKESQQ